MVSSLDEPMLVRVSQDNIDGIPVRNLWLLMLYASKLFRHLDSSKVAAEENPEDIPDLIAEFLSNVVERRLKRNLSFGYQNQIAELNRVRGRIDLLRTERKQLLSRGQIACQYEDLTVNTARNRFVRAALGSIAGIVSRRELAHRCLSLSESLRRIGVIGERPSRSEVSTERFGRHDAVDQRMVALAHLAFDLKLPTEFRGKRSLSVPHRESHWVRRLFEKAMAGFYDVNLSRQGWRIRAGKWIKWPIEKRTMGIDAILPSMQTDIVLDHSALGQRIVIDTKFSSIVKKGQYREKTLSSGYMYQLYAYLRSQEDGGDPLAATASGLLLHPAVGEIIDETAVIQGHSIRFATVNLGATANEIRAQLLQMVNFPLSSNFDAAQPTAAAEEN